MNVYLLPRRNEDYFLYSNDLPGERVGEVDKVDSAPTAPSSPTESSARKALNHARRGYERLTRNRRRREQLLETLGAGEPVTVLYPSSLSEEEARTVYRSLIQGAVDKHKKWMVANAAAVPVSVPLTLIPGPNVLLGYLAWRTVTHYKTTKAGERAAEMELDFVPEPLLAELATVVRSRRWFRRKKRIRRLGAQLGLDRLEDVV